MQQLTSLYHSTRGLNHIPRKQQRVFCFDKFIDLFIDGCMHITIKTNKNTVFTIYCIIYMHYFSVIYDQSVPHF